MTRSNLEPLDQAELRAWAVANLEDPRLRPVAMGVLSLLSRMTADDYLIAEARALVELEPSSEGWWRAYNRLSRTRI